MDGKHALTPAARYWAQNLDPQNLERDAAETAPIDPAAIAIEIGFARTPDWDAAMGWLGAGQSEPAWILDLGAGLGANSFAMAQSGQTVLAVDTSLARLQALRARAAAVGLRDRIGLLVAAAESLPFKDGSVPAIYTKSVLIHTDNQKTSREFVRVVRPGGRLALVEPQTGNPFVNAYRRTLAPAIWRSITHYFDEKQQRVFTRCPGLRAAANPVEAFYFLSFFAFVFQFGKPLPVLFRLTLRPLNWLDRLLFRLCPPLRRWAWFGVIRLERPPCR
jgi:SAM-dependent methyltransferase